MVKSGMLALGAGGVLALANTVPAAPMEVLAFHEKEVFPPATAGAVAAAPTAAASALNAPTLALPAPAVGETAAAFGQREEPAWQKMLPTYMRKIMYLSSDTPEELVAKYEAYQEGPWKFIRWLLWPAVIYVLWCQAVVCEEYFVSAIEAFVERYGIPEDVAGATLMALGCNGLELFTNLIALFVVPSDVGPGAVIGSEIFNELCILSIALLRSPFSPIEVEFIPFVRDATWYAISLCMLLVAYQGDVITQPQAMIVLFGMPMYSLTVIGTRPVMRWYYGGDGQGPVRKALGKQQSEDFQAMPGMEDKARKTESRVAIPGEMAQNLERQLSTQGRVRSNSTDLRERLLEGKVTAADLEAAGMKRSDVNQQIRRPSQDMMADPVEVDVEHFEELTAPTTAAGAVIYPFRWMMNKTLRWCDCRDPEMKHLWGCEFIGSVVWLGITSFFLCQFADQVGYAFNISQTLIGLTILAVGTSFPNWFASYIVAAKGRSAMAISNALGSNIQNVFLSLGLPWTLYTSMRGDLTLPDMQIEVQLCTFMIMHAIVVAMWIGSGYKFQRWQGWVLLALYIAYFIQNLVQCKQKQGFDPRLLNAGGN